MYHGLKQGQITPSIEYKYVLKLFHWVAQRSKFYKYSVISKTYIASFCRFLLLSTSNVRMSEGTFCRVEVHVCFTHKYSLIKVIVFGIHVSHTL